MKLTHKFAELMPERRPQDPHLNGAGLRFETMEHGGEYPDAMPQAIKLTDAEGRSCIYVPITQDGKVVDSQRSRSIWRTIDRGRHRHRGHPVQSRGARLLLIFVSDWKLA